MTGRSIKVSIGKFGDTKVEAVGFEGCGCTAATAPIEQALAGNLGVTRVEKGEMYAETQQQHETAQW